MLQHSSPNKALREASVASSKKLNAYYVEMAMRKDTFDRVCAFKELPAYQDLSAEMKRMVEKTIVEGKRNGLHLDEETRNQVKAVKTKIRFHKLERTSVLTFVATRSNDGQLTMTKLFVDTRNMTKTELVNF